MLSDLKEIVAVYKLPVMEGDDEAVPVEVVDETAVIDDTGTEEILIETEDEVVAETAVVEPEIEPEPIVEAVDDTVDIEEAVVEDVLEEEQSEEKEFIDAIDDLSKSLFDIEPEPQKAARKKPQKEVVIVRPGREPELEEKSGRSDKGRSLVYDEDLGEVIAKRKRKGSRKSRDWENFDLEDI